MTAPREGVFKYRRLAKELQEKITRGVYQPGEKLPSLRMLHRRLDVSISTVHQAYMELETTGLVEVRQKSGYYVAPRCLAKLKPPRAIKKSFSPQKVRLSSIINSVISAINNPKLISLGNPAISPDLFPVKYFSKILKDLSQKELREISNYTFSEGAEELKRQIAARYLGIIDEIDANDILITNGCTEAISLALLAIVRPGDTVAIEAPTNFGFLQLLKALRVRVTQVRTDPKNGVDIADLKKRIQQDHIKACLFIPNFHNPLGALMPEGKKQKLVQLLAQNNIPVIEDDISGELYFGGQRPGLLKCFDKKGLVLACSSFSKTVAPGFRVGWILPGKRFMERIRCLKAGMTVSTSTLSQHLFTQFLKSGAYERQLVSLRSTLHKQAIRTALSIQKSFPDQTRLAVPEGGSLIWVQLPSGVESESVYHRALEKGIAVIPGKVCANSGEFEEFIQISFGLPFTPQIEEAITTLGRQIYFQKSSKPKTAERQI